MGPLISIIAGDRPVTVAADHLQILEKIARRLRDKNMSDARIADVIYRFCRPEKSSITLIVEDVKVMWPVITLDVDITDYAEEARQVEAYLQGAHRYGLSDAEIEYDLWNRGLSHLRDS